MLIQNTSSLSVSIWLILLILFAATTVLFFIGQQSSSTNNQSPITNYQYPTAYLALACFACLGAIRLISFNQPRANDIRNLVADQRKLATIRGLIVTEPYVNQNRQWEFAEFQFTDPRSSFYLKINEVETTDGWTKVTGTVRVQVDEPVLDLKAGDYIKAYCWLDRFKEPTNPGQFDTAKYLARKNVFIAASVKTRDSIELLESDSVGILTKVKRKLRQAATQALLGSLSLEDRSRGLLEALLLGYRGNIDSATYTAFRKTGLLHFISLSGLHLGILAGIIWWLCKTVGLMKRARAIICIIAIGIFLLIVPPRAPTIRAAIICWVFCISFFFRRRSNSLNTLSLAAIILLLIRPTQLFEAGWQLSFASVLGLVLFCHRIHFFLYEKITGLPWRKKAPKARPFFRIISRPGAYLLRLFSTGLTAWLGGAGILLYHFYAITPLTFIWTVIVFPFVALILTIGFLKIILSFLLPTAAAVLGVIVAGLADLLIWVVRFIAHLDISQILVGHVPLAVIIFYYGFILFAGFANFRRPLMKKATCAVMASAIIVFLGVTKWQRTHRDNLVLTCLDVGHGQAILAQLPGKTNILFDAGSVHKADIGRRIVAPFLNYSGISEIDAIIISHNDIDHINGIPEIVQDCKVHAVYANEAFFDKTEEWGTASFLKERLLERGRKVQHLEEELTIGRSAGIRTLWPTEQISRDQSLGDNDKSLVSLIEFAGTEILLCSDIEKFAQRELLRHFPNLKADIAVVAHHGSARTAEPTFLKNLEAEVLIFSCGRRAYEKQQTIKPENAAKSLYTARDGAITICINKDGTVSTDIFAKK
ncbi:MAG: DNA internalization-related competence protein ComEC/Rec2 [Planctomycetota bacterium]